MQCTVAELVALEEPALRAIGKNSPHLTRQTGFGSDFAGSAKKRTVTGQKLRSLPLGEKIRLILNGWVFNLFVHHLYLLNLH